MEFLLNYCFWVTRCKRRATFLANCRPALTSTQFKGGVTLPVLWIDDDLKREDRMSSQTKPDVTNVIWTDTTHLSPVNLRTARQIQVGDRVFDTLGIEWDVIEVRREQVSGSGAWDGLTNDIYAPSVRWITVRLRQEIGR